jgi:hypothetical protein
MQLWLDVWRPNSATVAIADNPEKAARYGRDLAERLCGLRHAFAPKLSSIDFIIDRVEDPTAPKPVILVDPADSPNAGAPGDSMAVARRVLERGSTARSAAVVSDPAAVARVFEVGVGGLAEPRIGGHADTSASAPSGRSGMCVPVHDGESRQEFVGHEGRISRIGKALSQRRPRSPIQPRREIYHILHSFRLRADSRTELCGSGRYITYACARFESKLSRRFVPPGSPPAISSDKGCSE